MSTSQHKITNGALEEIQSFLTRLGQIARSFRTALRCAHETERLLRLPDGELAARGLKRDEIVQHAFRPYFLG